MKQATLIAVMVATAVAVAGAQTPTANPGDRIVVPLSDPSRPGTVTVKVVSGSISIRAENRRDVSVETSPAIRRDRDVPADARTLRRLSSPVGLIVEEENNTVMVRTERINSGVTLQIAVPMRTNLKLSAINGGAITVEGVQGEIEANHVNGSIALTNVGGSVVAHSNNGKIVATLRQITADMPMAFTSFNGNVDVTLPPPTKADLRLRSDNGDVFSDFDVQLRPNTGGRTVKDDRQGGGRYRVQVDRSIDGTINGGGPEFELRTINGNVYVRKGQ